MLRLTVSRVAQAIPVMFFMAAVSFLLLHAAPGNPAQLQAGLNATPEAVKAISRQLDLNRPLVVQFWAWFTRVLRGNLGTSYASGTPVTHLLAQRAPATLQLAVIAFVLVVVIGVPLGVWSALHRDRAPDHLAQAFTTFGIAFPNFTIGLLFVLLFGWFFPGILPYSGYVSVFSNPVSGLSHSILPAIALAVAPVGIVSRLTRAGMIEALGQEYVTAARAFGVSYREIVWRDALKGALLPVLTILGLVVGFLISGSVVVETVFSIPGLGNLLVSSFGNRDYPTAIGVMLVFSATFIIVNLVTDLLYGVVNPRVHSFYQQQSGV